jgi:hypothetical protein
MPARRRQKDDDRAADALAAGREMLDAARALDDVALLANIIALESALDAASAGEPGIDVEAIAADIRRLSERAALDRDTGRATNGSTAGRRRRRPTADRDALQDFGVLVRELLELAEDLASNERPSAAGRRRPQRAWRDRSRT